MAMNWLCSYTGTEYHTPMTTLHNFGMALTLYTRALHILEMFLKDSHLRYSCSNAWVIKEVWNVGGYRLDHGQYATETQLTVPSSHTETYNVGNIQ
jgi:hypothetical protein